jgi:hypothetical protein
MNKVDKRLQALERKSYPVLEFADMFNEEKIQAHRAKYGVNPRFKTIDQMYES